MKCLYIGTTFLALFTHAIALVIQIEVNKAVTGLDYYDDDDYSVQRSESVEPETLITIQPYADHDAQYLMSQRHGGDDVHIQDQLCDGTPNVAPRTYANNLIFTTMDRGYAALIKKINGYPKPFFKPVPQGLNPACNAGDVTTWEFPIVNQNAPNPGPDRLIFATSTRVVNAPPILCGLVAHTNPIGTKSTFKACGFI